MEIKCLKKKLNVHNFFFLNGFNQITQSPEKLGKKVIAFFLCQLKLGARELITTISYSQSYRGATAHDSMRL